jgi:hypothetical protein
MQSFLHAILGTAPFTLSPSASSGQATRSEVEGCSPYAQSQSALVASTLSVSVPAPRTKEREQEKGLQGEPERSFLPLHFSCKGALRGVILSSIKPTPAISAAVPRVLADGAVE